MSNFNKNNLSHPFYKKHDRVLAFYEEMEDKFCKKFKSILLKGLKSKYLKISLMFPLLFFFFSGFIYNSENSISGKLNTKEQFYPLKNESGKDFLPHSGKITLNNSISTIFSNNKFKQSLLENRKTLDTKIFKLTHIKINTQIEKSQAVYIKYEDLIKTLELTPATIIDKYIRYTNQAYARQKKAVTPFANFYADKFGLDRKLIMSIIEVESNFRPQALSKQNAHGLMQIVPSTAGAEVNRFFKQKKKINSHDLMHPETNIFYGTAYLYLLKKFHLEGIQDHENMNIILIASYNAGTGAVLRHFGKTREEAIKKINSMSAKEIYKTMTTEYKSSETRAYVRKVTQFMS